MDKYYTKEFAYRLKALRNKKRESQTTTAQNLIMSVSQLQKLERAERDPTVQTLLVVADYFHVSTDYLLNREEGNIPIILEEIQKNIASITLPS